MTNVSCHAGNEKLTSHEKLNINILSCLELKCFSRAFLLIRHYLIFSLGSLFISNAAVSQVYDYQTDYIQLESAIASNMNVPSEGANRVEPYLDAMEFKSGHRERAIMLYGAALADTSKWAPAFKALIDKAQESGDLTADQSARWLLYIQSHKRHLAVGNLLPDQWPDVIARLKKTGRRLLTKSRKYGFRDALIIDRAACMIRYSVMDLEVGHLGLYDGREVVFGKFDDQGILDMPDRDFDIDCEQRIEFSQQQKGCPLYPTEKGLEDAQKVRREAEWWGFSQSAEEVIQLMDKFFRDTLCIDPVSCLLESRVASGKGLEHYRKLADEYDLRKSQEHVEDFYGTLHGKVESYSKDGNQPASGADVANRSPKDEKEWKTTTDGQGLYEIGDVPLHKYCGPYQVEAILENGSDFREYKGPLEEPAPNARHQEDLEIVIADGKVEFNERFRWPPRAETRCNYEEPPDVVSFKVVPTRDPCIFTLKGSVSNPVTRKEYCRTQHPTWYQESWFEHERQTRLVGGTVDFRDKRIPPFRPWLEHRRNTARCDHHTAKDHGEEKRFSRGCFKPPKEWESTYLATPDVSKSFWGMPLQDGYVEDHRLGPQQRFSYTLHIDEKPFRRLDERCRKYTESHVPEAPQHTIKSGLGAPSETAFVRDTLDTTQKETDSSSLAQEHSPPGSESEDRALDRSQASLSYSKAGASETSGSKLPDESLSTHSPAPIAALDMLEQLMPEDGPPGWFTPQSAYESSQFAARMWVKAPDHLSISLFAYDANEDASRVFARKTGTKLVVGGFPAVETSKEVTMLIGRYLLMLKGKVELIREFLPYLDLAPTSPTNAVVQ